MELVLNQLWRGSTWLEVTAGMTAPQFLIAAVAIARRVNAMAFLAVSPYLNGHTLRANDVTAVLMLSLPQRAHEPQWTLRFLGDASSHPCNNAAAGDA